MTKLTNPIPLFLNGDGALIDAGCIYVGVAFDDPEVAPIAVYADAARTIPLAQPLRTLGGVIAVDGLPVSVFMEEADYSIRVRDADGGLVSYTRSALGETGTGVEYQPRSDALDAISAQGANSYGVSLLNLPNQAALRAATGIPNPLPITGGTITGNIVRGGGGPHLFHANTAYTGGRVYVTASTAGDPTQLPGDIWLTYDA